MKKMYCYLLGLAGAMMSITSCQEEFTSDSFNEDTQAIRIETVKVRTETDTKVSLSGTAFSWVDGDQIAVWTGTGSTAGSFQTCSVSGGSISVNLEGGAVRRNYAIYPESAADASNYGQTTLNVKLPASYDHAAILGTNTPLPMVARNENGQGLTFYNVAGLLRVTVKAIPNDATGLVFEFPGKKVNGTFTVSKPGTEEPFINTDPPGSGEDKITVNFTAGTATEMTLNIPLPVGEYEDVYISPKGSGTKVAAVRHIKAGGYDVSRAHGKQLTATLVSFTVNASGDKVIFAPGNLQATYNGSSWKWKLADHQYDFVGNNVANTKVTGSSPWVSENGTVDLFGWSTENKDVNYYGINNDPTDDSYTGSFKDWGDLAIGSYTGGFWSTPEASTSGWDYVITKRSINNSRGANLRYDIAMIENTYKGVIIYPDKYTHPTGVNISESGYFTAAVATLDDWALMEEAGAVFLPAAGYRETDSDVVKVTNEDRYVNYWSKTGAGNNANNLLFRVSTTENYYTIEGRIRYKGLSVRLVHVL